MQTFSAQIAELRGESQHDAICVVAPSIRKLLGDCEVPGLPSEVPHCFFFYLAVTIALLLPCERRTDDYANRCVEFVKNVIGDVAIYFSRDHARHMVINKKNSWSLDIRRDRQL